jgi:2-polyprenyl-3-methyl-5-hydroxy-6-metoxy-1,4-benzoquinol methylase
MKSACDFGVFESVVLNENKENCWFVEEYWPLNRPRLVRIVEILQKHIGNKSFNNFLVADIGCGCGYMSRFFKRMGFSVVGVDGYLEPSRDELFQIEGIRFDLANFNQDDSLQSIKDQEADIVVCGEVLEHILHHPAGFLLELSRICRQGGLCVLTTPNPATLMNAVRMLFGTYSMWGTAEFVNLRKYHQGNPINHPGIHYREFLPKQLAEMMRNAGFKIIAHEYIGAGSNKFDGLLKRIIKKLPGVHSLMKTRIMGSGQIIVAQKL